MAILTRTYTRTFNSYEGAWASTTPHDRRDCPDPCRAVHVHVGDMCASPGCGNYLKAGEECYSVTEVETEGPGEAWVCWRHIRPDDGPIKA